MRALEIQFHPEQIRISAEEILADLRYPAPSERQAARPRRRRRRRGRR